MFSLQATKSASESSDDGTYGSYYVISLPFPDKAPLHPLATLLQFLDFVPAHLSLAQPHALKNFSHS